MCTCAVQVRAHKLFIVAAIISVQIDMEATGGFSSIPEDQERASEDFINPESHQGMYNYNPGISVSSSSSCESISDSSSANDSCSLSEMMMENENGEQEVIYWSLRTR